jgi:hypothetical protein
MGEGCYFVVGVSLNQKTPSNVGASGLTAWRSVKKLLN